MRHWLLLIVLVCGCSGSNSAPQKNNLPLEKERAVNPVEHANPMVGGGTVQTFAHSRLAWTPARGVYLVPIGVELLFMEGKRVSTGPALPG